MSATGCQLRVRRPTGLDPPRGTRTAREYLDLRSPVGLSAREFGLRYRLDLGGRSAVSNRVQRTLRPSRASFGTRSSAAPSRQCRPRRPERPIVTSKMQGDAPFASIHYEEWLRTTEVPPRELPRPSRLDARSLLRRIPRPRLAYWAGAGRRLMKQFPEAVADGRRRACGRGTACQGHTEYYHASIAPPGDTTRPHSLANLPLPTPPLQWLQPLAADRHAQGASLTTCPRFAKFQRELG